MTFDGKLSKIIDKDTKLKRVLDVGTGTGIWAIDFGLKCSQDVIQAVLLTLSSGRASRSTSE